MRIPLALPSAVSKSVKNHPCRQTQQAVFPSVNTSTVRESKTDQNLFAREFMVKTGEINHAGTI
jgi:hypothetical protein